MSILFVCSVYDKQAESFGPVMVVAAKGLAIRGFIDEVNRESPDNQLYRHSDDFALYQVGTFDNSSGLLESVMPTLLLMDGATARAAS